MLPTAGRAGNSAEYLFLDLHTCHDEGKILKGTRESKEVESQNMSSREE